MAASVIHDFQGAPLRREDLAGMRAALEAAGLPAGDIAEQEVRCFRFVRGARQVGHGALEVHGGDVLLRSIVVEPGARGEGIGRRIVEWLLGHARSLGAEWAYLLTTNARPYFETLGFEAIARASAPDAILATRQAAGLCPASATLLAQPCRAAPPPKTEPQ